MTFLLFAGQDHYPSGGALDCVGVFAGSDEQAAVEWAERFDTDTVPWWESPDWKHLARVGASDLAIVRRWARDFELVPVEGGHHRKMKLWKLDAEEIR